VLAADLRRKSRPPSVIAPFRSAEHMEWLALRLSRNVRFRRMVNEAAAAVRRRRVEVA